MMRGQKEIILGKSDGRKKRISATRARIQRIVLLIAAGAFVFWAMDSMTRQTRLRQAQLDISRIGHAARLFRADFGRCPSGIVELVTPPEGTAYLTNSVDPWGNPYALVCPAYQDEKDVEVISRGPDGHLEGDDNIATLYFIGTP